MSETLFRFLVSELQRLRIVCKKCGATVEMSLDQLDNLSDEIRCPVCQEFLQKGPPADYHLTNLARLLRRLAKSDRVDVEFTLPAK